MSTVSVVMVSYHTGPALWLAIDAALEQPECRELVLVDNGNPPGVAARLKALAEKQPRIKLITGQGNIGFAKACNLGARSTGADYLLLLNPDAVLPEGGLARALAVIKAWPENTLAGCFLANSDGSEQRGSRRSLLTPRNAVAESLGLDMLVKPEERLNLYGTPMPENAHEVPAISGAFMLLSRAFYDRLGGLDEGYFLHMEDMDFCLRVHKAGGKVICMPEVKVMHLRSTSETSGNKVEKYKTRSFIRYLKTHYASSVSSLFLPCMSIGLWLRYGVRVLENAVDFIFMPPLAAQREVSRVVLLHRLTRFGPRNDSLKGKVILVTGGSGQTGLCVVGKALARGARVVAVHYRTDIPFTHPRLAWVKQDLTKAQIDAKVDAVINTTALWQLPGLMDGIIDKGTRRVIAFGSTTMFAKFNSKNVHEKNIVDNLRSSEGRITKIAFEKGGDVTILRPTLIYGVGLDSNVARLANVVKRFGVLAVYGRASGLRQPVQALDLADAALDILENKLTYGKSYNLGGGQTLTYREMLKGLFDYLGKKPRILNLPFLPVMLDILGKLYQVSHLNSEIARRMNQDQVFDTSGAGIDFGYKPKAYLEGDVVV